MNHTPGPWGLWEVPSAQGPVFIIGSVGEPRKVIANPTFDKDISAEEKLANAHLMAAAPKLLKACKAALYGVVNDGGPTGTSKIEVQDYLRDAIAEAEKL